MPIFAYFLSFDLCLPILHYLEMAKITNANAESLKETIDAFIIQKGLSTEKLIHFGSNGALNMQGEY